MASPSPGERNGERTGRMYYIAVKGVDEIKLKEFSRFAIKKALNIRALVLITL